ncbi:MAG: chorismate mutase [Deltaproteobacteria bacterium]|nr:chorismate mutase [Deltaproteobacteria bacterium]
MSEGIPGLRLLARDPASPDDGAFVENGVRLGGGSFHVFAGLCAVDTRDNLERAFAALARAGVVTARAGAWKPRTSPYDFQGRGAACLPEVFEAAGKHGIKLVAMELTRAAQLEELAAALDAAGGPTSVLVQVGTRNAQNFELLKEVGAQQRFPVLLKRGMGITLSESLLAAEYVAKAGNPRVAFCLRGVRTHLGEPQRNLVDFAQVPAVKRLTRMPVCADPSHAVGPRVRSREGLDDLHHVAAQAVIAGADMLLVDVHPRPEEALCDGPQALTLDELPRFLADVNVARAAWEERRRAAASIPAPPAADAAVQFEALRRRFEAIDATLVALLAERMLASRAMVHAKSALKLPVVDAARERDAAAARRALGDKLGVDAELLDRVFAEVVEWSRRLQGG